MNGTLKCVDLGTSLVVQWLRLCAPTIGGTGSILCEETKTPQAFSTAEKKSVGLKKLMSIV